MSHKQPEQAVDHIAFRGVKALRWTFDVLAGFKTGVIDEHKCEETIFRLVPVICVNIEETGIGWNCPEPCGRPVVIHDAPQEATKMVQNNQGKPAVKFGVWNDLFEGYKVQFLKLPPSPTEMQALPGVGRGCSTRRNTQQSVLVEETLGERVRASKASSQISSATSCSLYAPVFSAKPVVRRLGCTES